MPSYKPTNVELAKLRPVLKELIDRCGSPEAAGEYASISTSTMYRMIHGYHRTVTQHTARLVILALYQRRKEDRMNGASKRFNQARKHQAELEDRLNRLAGY